MPSSEGTLLASEGATAGRDEVDEFAGFEGSSYCGVCLEAWSRQREQYQARIDALEARLAAVREAAQ